jgi:hypothetical protein
MSYQVDDLDAPPATDDWTPAKGMLRGASYGGIAALVIIILLAPLALWLPYFLIPGILRGAWAFGITWLLLKIVERASGMVGPLNTLVVVHLTVLILLSHHLIFALHGVPALLGLPSCWMFPAQIVESVIPEAQGYLAGWRWFHPYVLLAVTGLPLLIGGGACVKLHSID